MITDVDDDAPSDWAPLTEATFGQHHAEAHAAVLLDVERWLESEGVAPRSRERMIAKARTFLESLEEIRRCEFVGKGLLPPPSMQ